MKHLPYLSLLFLGILVTRLSFAQVCDDKQIKTGPANTYPGGAPSPVNNENSPAVNRFNWMLNPTTDGINFRFTPINAGTKYLLSPWHVNDPNIDYFPLARGTNSAYKPADGWEVFKVNLGRLNDDISQRMRAPVVPYIILYNRYTGILRVFAYLDRTNDYNTIDVNLSIDDKNATNGLNYSAILSLHDALAQPLDQSTKIKSVKVMAKYPNNQSLFFWADFPLAYDPCACNYKSNMKVTFRAITKGEINMTGTIVGTVKPVLKNNSGNPLTVIKNAVAGITSLASGVITGNFLDVFSAFNSFLSMDNATAEIKQGLEIFKNLVSLGQNLDNINDTDKNKAIKALTAVNNFFTSTIKSSGSGGGASIITATAVLSGTLENETEFGNSLIQFSTPGSKDSHLNPEENYNNQVDGYGNLLPEYPAYNEILGTFGLLRKPVVNVSYQETGTGPAPRYPGDPYNPWFVRASRVRFKIPAIYTENGITYANSFMYALNPVMHPNLNNTKVKAAIIIRKKIGAYCDGYQPLFRGVYTNNPIVNLSCITDKYPNRYNTIVPLTWPDETIYAHQVDWYTGDNHTETCDTYEFISTIVPIEFVYDLQGEISFYGTNFNQDDVYSGVPFDPTVDEVRLKFFIDFESTDIGSNGQPNKSTMVFTYPVNLKTISEFPINGNIDLTQYRTPIPPVSQSVLNQYCTSQYNGSTYGAKNLAARLEYANTVITEEKEPAAKNADLLYVWPNPAQKFINIKFNIEKETPVTVNIYNTQMQNVSGEIKLGNRRAGQYDQKLDVGKLNAGTYFVLLTTKDKTLKTKLVIVK